MPSLIKCKDCLHKSYSYSASPYDSEQHQFRNQKLTYQLGREALRAGLEEVGGPESSLGLGRLCLEPKCEETSSEARILLRKIILGLFVMNVSVVEVC